MRYEAITHKIIGCSMKVYSAPGNGFQEVIYQRALAIEMAKQGLGFKREMGGLINKSSPSAMSSCIASAQEGRDICV